MKGESVTIFRQDDCSCMPCGMNNSKWALTWATFGCLRHFLGVTFIDS